ncbi:hypothetical protein SBF1_2240013 [Candidatus Desulfosporosinus infrequens]|uniref:Uncharacterized protein n=1 Tax=Candidatus Desulfosporosinus infrequens TaxID=2043169 RepID=A0A2U3KLL7_9FIRM|nr:hypothetical protein SBF1_2240013 [Candidatus Desulfosporosinus infrequens]
MRDGPSLAVAAKFSAEFFLKNRCEVKIYGKMKVTVNRGGY